MKNFLRHILASVALLLAAIAPAQASSSTSLELVPYGQAPANAALYAFADVYRLTVAGAAMADYPVAGLQSLRLSEIRALADMPVRVAAAEPLATGYVFSIASVPAPQGWLLLLSGFAMAGWVARRRLFHSL